MPTFASQNYPFNSPQLLQKGVACYLLGSYNYKQADTRMLVSNVALTTNVATVTVQITAGEVPVVGALISINQTATSAGVFNVSRATITAVAINSTTGAGTISFALTNANVSSTADAGSAIAEVREVPETIVNGASAACSLRAPEGDSQRSIVFAVTCPTIPTAATFTLQRALRNVDSEYTNTSAVVTIATSAFTAGPAVEATLERGYFYRILTSGLSGSGTAVGKVGG